MAGYTIGELYIRERRLGKEFQREDILERRRVGARI